MFCSITASLRSRRLEVVGTRKNARERLACLPRARPFSLSTSKCLLRRPHYCKTNLNSDIARFRPPTSQTCLATNHKSKVVAGCEQFVQKVKRESSSIYFLQQNLYINVSECFAFYRPKANLFCIKWRKAPHVWRDSCVRPFSSCPKSLIQSEAKCDLKMIFCLINLFSQERICTSPRFEKLETTWLVAGLVSK